MNKKLIQWVSAGVAILVVGTLWWQITKRNVMEYKPYTFKQKTLSNGMKVLLVKEKQLPYLSLDIMFKTGSKMDPKGKEGLLSLLSEIIDKGTQNRSAIKTAEDMEILGTGFSYSLGRDSLNFSVETLAWLDEEVLQIFSEIVTQPALSQSEFQRAKQKAIGSAKRRSEQFSSFASQIFNQKLYESHPYGFYKYGGLKSLKAIQLKDVKDFYQNHFQPEKALLAVSGQYPSDIIEKLEKTFGQWKSSSKVKEKQTEISVVPSAKKMPLLLVDHPSAVQSEIRMGHISPLSRSHPDYLPFRLANVILGAGAMLESRLMNRIREQKGLTYSVFSYMFARKELGAFKIQLAVRNDKVGRALLETIGVLEDFHKNGINKKEYERAKQILKNYFITGTSSADQFAQYLLYLNSQNIPYTYMVKYLEKLENLSLKKVNAVIKKHLHPDKISILIFSNKAQVKSQLKDFEPLVIKNYKDFL